MSQVKVPLSYAPKRKFLERISENLANDQNEDQKIALTLPRMSFETVSMSYDLGRQLPKLNYCIVPGTDKSNKKKVYTKTPYSIQFQLNIYVRSHDDALQLVEQILPYFQPQYTLTVKPLDDYPTVKDDVPILLQGVSFSDDFEGPVAGRRTIVYTLDFELKMDFYSPQLEGKIVELVEIDYFVDNDSDQYSTQTITTSPRPVDPDSDYTFVETLVLKVDSE